MCYGRRKCPYLALNTLLVQSESRCWHVVLPADQPSNSSQLRVNDSQPITCALAPDESFGCSWNEFPMG